MALGSKNLKHVIENYKPRENVIVCVCGWTGNNQEWGEHKRIMKENPDEVLRPNPLKTSWHRIHGGGKGTT